MRELLSWLGKRIIQKSCLLLFIWIPYGARTRNRTPDFSGHTIIAATHNNFYCDICVVGNETRDLPGWLAKVGLFRGPFNSILRWLGALPVVRILDASRLGKDARQVNEASFQAVVQALQRPGAFCIFPEGNSLERPGLNLPLKNGIAKLAFAAEAAKDFGLGSKIVPMGIDYHHRTRVGGGVTIRYAEPIYLQEYATEFRQNPKAAEQRLLARLAKSLSENYPHFENDLELALALRFEALAQKWDLFTISKLYDQKRSDGFLGELERNLDVVERTGRRARVFGRSAEASDIGAWLRWTEMGKSERCKNIVAAAALFPLLLAERLNNSLPDWWMETFRRRLSRSTPDFMTLKVALALLFLPPIYMLQFAMINAAFPNMWGSIRFPFFVYCIIGILSWRWRHRWMPKFRMVKLVLFCRKRRFLFEAVSILRAFEAKIR